METIKNIAFICIVILALLGAKDYIVESVRMFRDALKRYRDRN